MLHLHRHLPGSALPVGKGWPRCPITARTAWSALFVRPSRARRLGSVGAALLAVLFAALPISACARAARAQTREPDPIESLLSRMTLEEKAGQLSQWSGGLNPTGPKAAAGSEDDIRRGRVGSFLGVWGADTTRRLQRIAVEKSRLHIPLLFSADVIHGFRTIFPVPLAEASSWDVDLAQRCARAAALEATAYGLHWTYAPMVDVARDARWGRVVEGAGEDPLLVSAFAVARVRGFQGGSAADATRMLATAKHFVAYGAAEGGRDYNTVDVSDRTLREIYLPPFHAAVQAGVASVMAAFNEVAGIPMHENRALLSGVLRDRWGFHGIIVSDYTGIAELMRHGVSADPRQAALSALQAGVDVDMLSNAYLTELPKLVRSGQLQQRVVDDAVRRVLQAKRTLGLFDDPYRYSDASRERTRILTKQSRALARQAGDEAIVLLKNDAQLLPLRKNLDRLALVGALADDAVASLGSWAALGEPRDTVTVRAGIEAAVSPHTHVIYARGAAPDSDDTSGFDAALAAARSADAIVYVAGERADMSGEASSRSAIGLPGAQAELLERLQATGKPLVLLLMNGRPLALPWAAEHVPAILETWFLGVETGHAVADVLFGDVDPSGKLPITFPRAVGQLPLYYDHKPTGRPPAESEHYTSKYLDVPWTPLYPFGHGLSYTQWSYSAPRLSATRIGANDTLTVRVDVHNTGSRPGTQVIQLYLHDEVASVTRPVRTLRRWKRVSLQPGASSQVSFTLEPDDLALLDVHLRRVVEPGWFTVEVGTSSQDVRKARFEVTSFAHLKGEGSAIPRFLREERGRNQP